MQKAKLCMQKNISKTQPQSLKKVSSNVLLETAPVKAKGGAPLGAFYV